MKKRKSLNKKIEGLKARLAKDAKKLAKLTMKLAAATTGRTRGKRKSGARKARASAKKTSSRRASAKPATTGKKPKKKLNLTPERRAQLAAAMKARWEAKRVAATANSQGASGNQGFAPGQGSQP